MLSVAKHGEWMHRYSKTVWPNHMNRASHTDTIVFHKIPVRNSRAQIRDLARTTTSGCINAQAILRLWAKRVAHLHLHPLLRTTLLRNLPAALPLLTRPFTLHYAHQGHQLLETWTGKYFSRPSSSSAFRSLYSPYTSHWRSSKALSPPPIAQQSTRSLPSMNEISKRWLIRLGNPQVWPHFLFGTNASLTNTIPTDTFGIVGRRWTLPQGMDNCNTNKDLVTLGKWIFGRGCWRAERAGNTTHQRSWTWEILLYWVKEINRSLVDWLSCYEDGARFE